MAEPLKREWNTGYLPHKPNAYVHRMDYGDCIAVIFERNVFDVEVRLWLADELVLHTFAVNTYMARSQVADWLDKNYPL